MPEPSLTLRLLNLDRYPCVTSAAPGRLLWDFPPSPVDQAAAGSLYHWPLTAPTIQPPGPYDQLPSLPTPPILTGTDPHSFAAFPSDSGCPPLAAEQLAGPPRAPGDQGAAYLRFLQGPVDAILLPNGAEPDRVGGYGPPTVFGSYQEPATLHLAPNGSPPAPLDIGLRLSRMYGTVERLEDGNWIKEEPPTPANGDWGVPTPAGVPRNIHPANAVEGPPRPGNGEDDEEASNRKGRRRLNEGLRTETSNTRQIGACIRCHNQRIRCRPNKLDPTNPDAPCESCLLVRKASKKTIHYISCLRFKVTSMVVYRAGGLGYTKRFDHTKIVDVDGYSDGITYDIEITQGLCQTPILLKVRRFRPNQTDKTHWSYRVDDTTCAHRSQDTGAFCLVNIKETAKKFNDYIACNAADGLAEAVKDSDDMVKEVFAMIEKQCRSLPVWNPNLHPLQPPRLA
ncbi:hypothetical protein CHGG_07380 [Chaetomium globosum CBS 148.51]|uniref:Zn(2)-C6 fungal-type domain-containing protein n=1 Tax=Chaetomium globosum (strain ATCC 6205 / CBS 148.51 / DSM 1962 / NBRC 6347 / NRRL 1970) TaxID=306901 RepID=Q2GXC4_CHAGB|nr:uncharacterized protein CHGG_07380 [Chaetomium globosum CBS 148.51]EAQ86127.1 hypothetical protein CHGG_07380 [Chaetomium globosum CBS 148.51]